MAKPTILMVDDDPVVSRAITTDLCRRYGAEYHIVRAVSGDGALKILREFRLRALTRPPCALDTSSPGMSAAGDVRLRWIKRLASAVGEGEMSVYFVHRYLATI